MGLLGAFVGGMANSVSEQIRRNDEDERVAKLLQLKEDAATRRMVLQQEYADERRRKQNQATNERLGSNVEYELGQVFGSPEPGPTPLNPEQQAVQEEGLRQQQRQKERARLMMMADPQRKLQAAADEGFVTPQELASIDSKSAIAKLQHEAALTKNNTQFQISLARLEQAGQIADAKSQQRLAEMESRQARDSSGKPPSGYRFKPDGNLEAIPGGPADTKIQGALNGDTAQLGSTTDALNRLALTANQLLNHPGLDGITGIQSKLPSLPGGDAANAQAMLETLKSQVGFGVLQAMRDASKTGGALGSVSDAEGKRLEANLAALNQAQSLEQFKSQLKQILDYSEQAKGRLRDSFNLKHGDRLPADRLSPGSVPRISSPDQLADLPSGSTFIAPDGSLRVKP